MARFLIVGGTGSLGKKLIDRLLPEHDVAVYSRDEAKHWSLSNTLANHPQRSSLRFFVGDIRDKQRLQTAIDTFRPDNVIIAAALKQVDTCELSPSESVMTNLIGTQNVVDAVSNRKARDEINVLFVSTDKAAAPVNVYGMCKAISERIVTSLAKEQDDDVRYLCTRYGNVLESRGSIIPLFKYQSAHHEFLTVTDPNMTRFLMTLDDSVDLIIHTLKFGTSGETWIPRLPAMRIGDLADIFAKRYGKTVKVIGLRPGEKLHEDLITESESVRVAPHEGAHGSHHVIGPAYEAGTGDRFTYSSSQDVMTAMQLEQHLDQLGIFDASLDSFIGRSIEEIDQQHIQPFVSVVNACSLKPLSMIKPVVPQCLGTGKCRKAA